MPRLGDRALALLLCLLTIGLYSYKLGEMEFFRHTEADRTLIAWEMVEKGNFLVPHLLGSEILTKPPLFYWILAAFISLFGEATEWVVRFPSVIFAGLFVGFQFLFLRALKFDRNLALVGAGILATGAAIQDYSRLAEIDMLFGFLSGVVFALGYLSIELRSLPLTFATYLLLSLSFLAKGPPALAFYGIGVLSFFVWSWRRPEASRMPRTVIRRLLKFHCWGVLIGLVPIFIWASSLAARVGWEKLGRQVRVEIIERVFETSTHAHGPFFYVQAVVLSLLPWILLILAALLKRWRKDDVVGSGVKPELMRFWMWNLGIVLPALLLLTFASGKSNRYMFPLYGPLCNLAFLSLLSLRGSKTEGQLLSLTRYLAMALGLASLLAPFFVRSVVAPYGVSFWSLLLLGALVAALSFTLAALLKFQMKKDAFIAICLMMGLAQVVRAELVTPYLNGRRSVKPIAESLQSLVPKGEQLYTIEFFDRWINYYLKRLGTESLRLSPEVAEDLKSHPGKKFLLLERPDEAWRYERMQTFDPSAKIVKSYPDKKQEVILVEAAGEQLFRLKPHDFFPTVPSLPYD